MQANIQEENRREPTSNNKKILFIICLYAFLIMSTRYTPNDGTIKTAIIKQKMMQKEGEISLEDTLKAFSSQQIYEGKWMKQTRNTHEQANNFISEQEGKFRMYIDLPSTSISTFLYRIEMEIYNGYYIDKGTTYLDLYLDNNNFSFQKNSTSFATLFFNQSNQAQIAAIYRKDEILITTEESSVNITSFNFTFNEPLKDKFAISFTLEAKDTTLTFTAMKPQNKAGGIMVFAAIMLFCSYMSFSSLMSIIRGIFELQDNSRKYSFITIMLTNMWDTVLCIVCFSLAFKDQQSLMLFIIPAFLLCLLFTNLQPRLMVYIYQNFADNNFNVRQLLCRFNLFHYGSLFSIYPILLLTNFNWILFIGLSCIMFPQIYANALINIRPELSSPYYLKYLLSRFILIFYLKCNPYNIFSLQPDYILSALCFLLIATQYGLLLIQKVYGSKKVIPNLLLQPVFDYKLQEQFNIEEGSQYPECSICLAPLHVDPPKNENDLDFEPKFKLMKTPCKHQYHSHCLMVWMKIKMQCPQCRLKLPPYQ